MAAWTRRSVTSPVRTCPSTIRLRACTRSIAASMPAALAEAAQTPDRARRQPRMRFGGAGMCRAVKAKSGEQDVAWVDHGGVAERDGLVIRAVVHLPVGRIELGEGRSGTEILEQ